MPTQARVKLAAWRRMAWPAGREKKGFGNIKTGVTYTQHDVYKHEEPDVKMRNVAV